MAVYYNPSGFWVFVTQFDYDSLSSSEINATLTDYYDAGINGILMDVTTSGSQNNYKKWAPHVLNHNLGIAASVAPLATINATDFWDGIHTWQEDRLTTSQHPAFYVHDCENFSTDACWTADSLKTFVDTFKSTFPVYAQNDSIGCTSYGDTQQFEITCSTVFPWKTILDNYGFFIPQVYGWCFQPSPCTPQSGSYGSTVWEESSGEPIDTYEWRFQLGTSVSTTVNCGFIYPALGAFDSAYPTYLADVITKATSCPGFLFYRYTYVTSSGYCSYYSQALPNPVILDALSEAG